MKKYLILLLFITLPIASGAQTNKDLLMKAKALIERGKPAEAITLLSVLPGSPDPDQLLILGEAELNAGDYSGAARDFNKANSLSPASGEYGLARISALKGDVKNSLAHLELNISSTYRKGEKEIMLDPAFSTLENRQEWRSFWKTERYSSTEKKITELEFNISAGKKDDASAIVENLKSMYPGEDATMYGTALFAYSLQKYPESISLLNRLLAADARNEKYLQLLALVQVASGNSAGASDTYTALLNNGSLDASVYLKRAECYRKTGETEKSVADLAAYLSFYPENRDALSMMGRLTAQTGDNLKAIELFTDNLKLHPNDPACWLDRGNSYFNSGSWDYAINDYGMSLDIKPDNPDVWLNKGISLLKTGKVQDACHDFRRALSLGNRKAATYINSNCIK
jgi:tetratricopeptide (TPR) repeat protein